MDSHAGNQLHRLEAGGDATSTLRSFIEDGDYNPGDRLPPEREMTALLGLGRSALRRALDRLEREGRIWRHVGKGTFLTEDFAGPRKDVVLTLGEQLTPIKMMRARQCIEPALAREAAVNAATVAVAKIRQSEARTKVASSWSSYETADDAFHRAVAEAADNLLLLSLFDQLNRVRRAVTWGAVFRSSDRPAGDHPSFLEHKIIADAIEARNPAAAQNAMRRHIGSVSARLFGEV